MGDDVCTGGKCEEDTLVPYTYIYKKNETPHVCLLSAGELYRIKIEAGRKGAVNRATLRPS